MPELVAGDETAAAWIAAADERYRSLDSHMFVELGGRMPHKFLRPATDAAIGLVLPELKKVYVGYLAACEERDELRQRVAELEALAPADYSDVRIGTCRACGTASEDCDVSADAPECNTDGRPSYCCDDCEHAVEDAE